VRPRADCLGRTRGRVTKTPTRMERELIKMNPSGHSGYGFHYGPCHSGRGISVGGLVVVAVVVAAVAKRHTVERGADELLTVVASALAVAVVLTVATVVTVLAVRVRQLSGPVRQLAEARDRAAEAMTPETSHRVIRADAVTRPALEAAPAWPHTAWVSAADEAEAKR
jgi:hypothetical protein